MKKEAPRPPRRTDEFYGTKYSIPVLCWDAKGTLKNKLVCWDYDNKGWVEADLGEGPNPEDYEIDVQVWKIPVLRETTLNEQQINLLREYREKDVEFQAAKTAMAGADFMSKDFDRAANEFSRTNHNRLQAASIFAASVAADFWTEVDNG